MLKRKTDEKLENDFPKIYSILPYTSQPLAIGIVGSTAYGLSTNNSDTDYLSIHYTQTKNVLKPNPAAYIDTKICTEPDIASHEIGKYIHLYKNCNPTIIEMLWLENYIYQHPLFEGLKQLRHTTLSAKKIKTSYVGYAKAQFKKFVARKEQGKDGFESTLKKRTNKHARHCIRLLLQGQQLLETGILPINMTDRADYIREKVSLFNEDFSLFQEWLNDKIAYVDNIVSPHFGSFSNELLDDWLVDFRLKILEEDK